MRSSQNCRMSQTESRIESQSAPGKPRSRTLAWVCLGSVILLIGLVAGWMWFSGPNADELRRQARTAHRRGSYAEALQLASQAWQVRPDNKMALIAGEAAQRMKQFDDAMVWYGRLKQEDSEDFVNGAVAQALLCLNVGRLTESEVWFRKALAQRPQSVEINRWFGTLLNAEGRRWEASSHFFAAVRYGAFSGETSMTDLLMLANFEAPFDDNPVTETAIRAVPDDPIPLLGRVQTHFIQNRYSEGLEILRSVIATHPHLMQAHAWLGRGLVDSGALDQVPEWNTALPEGADEFPMIWHVRGLWAAKVGQSAAAARCFWEAVRREPSYSSANYQLGLTLVAMNQPDAAAPFLERHARLSDYHQTTHPIYNEGPSAKSLERVMDLSGELGRPWEQFAWSKFLIGHGQQEELSPQLQTKANGVYQRLLTRLRENPPGRHSPEAFIAKAIDLSGNPLPAWSAPDSSRQQAPVVADLADIRFDDVAAERGIDFTYFNSAERRTRGMRIFESTGGGVGAFDFDLDAWPDLYFTQGSVWPVNPDKPGPIDRLFRSLGGEQFHDVTELAGLIDPNYSQGVTVGDVDNDGFPDLYLANIGANRLFHNNGDGTFTEQTVGFDKRPARWTTSVMLADLNADGLPDAFDVNYLSGDDVYDRLCGAEVQRVCAPSAFAGEQDDVYFNNGDGTWTCATELTGLSEVVGKGLGIIAADFDGTGRLSIFIANDGIANYFLVPDGSGRDLKYRDAGLERGVAFDYDSRGQACMGVTADDFDGDNRLDLFVTNYYEDSNTLYTMLPGDLFEDRSRDAGLRDPSFYFLGFGTQALDANLDGWPDLAITNGHIDDFSHEKIPFRMRPQFYQNLGGTFREVPPAADSPYMNTPQLGRGMARLDYNRDGRMDFAVSHLDTPAALAENRTTDAGHYLSIRLIGRESSRDAIGTSITATLSDNRARTMQLVGGDGYQAVNQRRLVVGVGDLERVPQLVVQWPSGVRQTFRDLPADTELTIHEGQAVFHTIPR